MGSSLRKLIIILITLLTGCSVLPERLHRPPKPVVVKENSIPLPSVSSSHWTAKGRLAVTQARKGGNASFFWEQNGDHSRIRLHGPFGAGSVIITADPQGILAIDAKGEKHQAASAEELMEKLAGWHVPLSGLRYWIRGLPIPGVPIAVQQINKEGCLQRLSQNGWIIHYHQYIDDKELLPKRIELRNPKLKIKLVITAWG